MNRKTWKILLCGLLALAPLGALESAAESAGAWDDETLEAFASVPVQDGGRIKPLGTLASVKLLKLNGKRYYKPEDGKTLTPLEWMLDCIFFPAVAEDYDCFRVSDSEVVTAIGATAHVKRQDYYTYRELEPARAKLFELAGQYSAIEYKQRSSKQRTLLDLAHNINEFEMLTHFAESAVQEFHIHDSPLLSKLFGGKEVVTLTDLAANAAAVRAAVLAAREPGKDDSETLSKAETDLISEMFNGLDFARRMADAWAVVPPVDPEEKEWSTPGAVLGRTFSSAPPTESELAIVAAFEHLAKNLENKLAFGQAASAFRDVVVAQAEARGEYDKIPMEISLYKGKYFFYAQWLFVFSFILVAISWLLPRARLLYPAIYVAISVPLALLVIGIVLRCIIRGRPPVTTLYETVLFTTATAVITALFMEYVNRQRIALAIASFLGVFGMFIAHKYELSNKEDTMPSMVAVLDTNFWLATHVTTITMGYAAGLLAAAISHIFVFAKLLNLKKNDEEFYRTITRMVYGIICFGLLFSFIGTVLGGIWANYSWGRFWGWDPKENGALLIVLCNLAILHARKGKYIDQLGLHVSAIFTGCVIAFSWWGVNLLGVGLHAYGFTAGIWNSLLLFWGIEVFVMLLGFAILLRDWSVKKAIATLKDA